MTKADEQNETRSADEALKAMSGLDAATDDLKKENEKGCATSEDDVVSILTVIGRAIIQIFK